VEIILNLKALSLRINDNETHTLVIDTDKPGVVRAKDIQAPAAVEIVNPQMPICTLEEGAHLKMEMTAKRGAAMFPRRGTRCRTSPSDHPRRFYFLAHTQGQFSR